MDEYDAQGVIVIGGGVAGLSAAAYLARAGVAVTLFEKASHLGGRAATQEIEGYYFNRGAHAIYQGGAATQVLRELGVRYEAGHPGGVLALRGGTLARLPADPASLLQSDLLNAGEKWTLLRLLLGVAARPAAALRSLSITEWLDQQAPPPRVRQVLAALARTFTYSAALDQVSAEVFATQLKGAMRPVVYVAGGWQTLVDGLARVAAQAGARLMRSTAVAALEPGPERGQVRGVRLADGRVVTGRAVILATDLPPAAQLLAALDPAVAGRITGGVPIQVACLDVALRRLPVPRQAVVFDLDGPHFQTAQSAFTKVAPAGGGLIHTLKYLDPARPSDPHADAQELETLLDTSQPGWRTGLVHRQYLPRITAAGWMPTAATGGLAGRPAPQVPGWPNLFLAGDWVGSEGFLLDATLASARQVGRLAGATVAAARSSRPAAPEVVLAR